MLFEFFNHKGTQRDFTKEHEVIEYLTITYVRLREGPSCDFVV